MAVNAKMERAVTHVHVQEVCLFTFIISLVYLGFTFFLNVEISRNFFQVGQEVDVKMPSVFAKTNLVKTMLNVLICLRITSAYVPKALMVKIVRPLLIVA